MSDSALVRFRRSRWTHVAGPIVVVAASVALWPLDSLPYIISILLVGELARLVVYGRSKP